jgi:hypothetical protein
MKMLYAAGFRGKGLQTAFAVSMAESKLDPSAVGDVKLQDKKWGASYGLFQIRSLKHWQDYNDPWRDGTKLKNPKYNIEAAWVKSKHGRNWTPWSTYTGGEFMRYLDDASVAAKNTGLGGSTAEGMSLSSTGIHSTGSRSSTATLNTHQNVTIKVEMHVNIQNASYREADQMVNTFAKQLKNRLKIEGIGVA